ncbi:hypothetical protein D3C73_775600 [compost metagenome]
MRGCHPLKGHPSQEDIGDIITGHRIGQQRQIQFVVIQLAIEHGPHVNGDFQRDFRKVRLDFGDHRRQPNHRRTFVSADAQSAILFLLGRKLLQLDAVVQRQLCVLQGDQAVGGDGHALLAAVEQFHTQQGLHLPDARGDGRLGQMKMSRGRVHAP